LLLGVHVIEGQLEWSVMVQEASVTAKDLANRKEILQQLQASIATDFKLRTIKIGCQQAQGMLSVSDVLEQIDALKIVQVRLFRCAPFHQLGECSTRLASEESGIVILP
jgi:hypothetical protein